MFGTREIETGFLHIFLDGALHNFFISLSLNSIMIFTLFEEIENIPAILLKENVLPFQIIADLFILFLNRLASPIYLLKEHLNKMSLTSAQLFHLIQMLVLLSLVSTFGTWFKCAALFFH